MIDRIGSRGAVAAGSRFAARIGMDTLLAGGNAVDAAVAALLTECVVQPHNVGLGAYAGTMLIYLAEQRRTVAVDFTSGAPVAATAGMFPVDKCSLNWDMTSDGSDGTPGVNELGYLCVTAPPIAAGLALALDRFGTMSFSELALPAQGIAENGFRVYPELALALKHYALRAEPRSARDLLRYGRPPQAGEVLVQPRVAELIQHLRDHGPLSFYEDDIPRIICDQVKRGGGILDEADFANVAPRIEAPVSIECAGFHIHTPAPPAGGLTALQAVKIVDGFDLTDTDFGSARYYHLFIEAARHAWSDRHELLGDPLRVDVPMDEMLSERRAADIRRRIDGGGEPTAPLTPLAAGPGHTVHLVSADEKHNMVSVTMTHGGWFGSLVCIDELGLVLGHGMSRFDPLPGRANSIAPGKRVQHNMSPIIATRRGEPYCAFGLPGGRRIVNVGALLAHSIARHGLTCGQAIDLPRFHVDGPGPASVDSQEIAERIWRRVGRNYPLQVSKKRLGGPVSGVMYASQTGQLLAASEAGPDCTAVL